MPVKKIGQKSGAEGERGGVQSAEVAMRVLVALAEGGGEMNLKDLALSASMAPAKVHRYLASMINAGFVEQQRYTGRYRLGRQALSVGLVALGRVDVMEVGAQILYDLKEKLDLCVTMSVWGSNGPVIVRKLETSRPVIVNTRVGSNIPILYSAGGLIFGAYMDTDQVAPFITRELAQRSPNDETSPRTRKEATEILAEVRARGTSRVTGQMLAGVTGLGAPVFNSDGQIAAAITVLAPSSSFDDRLIDAVSEELRRAANDFSRGLGYLESGGGAGGAEK